MTKPTTHILVGDCIQKLRELPAKSAHCCITSPPYWGLRDYGNDAQIGMEDSPEEFVAKMVEVFREVHRVLRDDGTLWLNLGDSYSGPKGDTFSGLGQSLEDRVGASKGGVITAKSGLPPKNLVGIPWRVALALQADGWYLRQDIIWAKPSPMPESVEDRCTKSHEYIFLMAKSERYFFDNIAIKEPLANANAQRTTTHYDTAVRYGAGNGGNSGLDGLAAAMRDGTHVSRNRRSVWTIATKPYKGAHFATFPTTLVTPMILAGTSAKGCCPKCGAPWERVTLHPGNPEGILGYAGVPHVSGTKGSNRDAPLHLHAPNGVRSKPGHEGTQYDKTIDTGEWEPTCKCQEHEPVPCTVLDPFTGSGTTLAVAVKNGRNGVGCELNPEYVKIADERILRSFGGVPNPWDDEREEEAQVDLGSIEDLFGFGPDE